MTVQLPNEIIDRIFKISENTNLLGNFKSIISKETEEHLEYVKWINENKKSPIIKAVCAGRIDILETFCRYGNTLPSDSISYACCTGNLKSVKWLYDFGEELTGDSMVYAVSQGQLEVVEWLYSMGGSVNSDLVDSAIIYNQTEIVKFFYSKGYMCSILGLVKSIENENHEITDIIKSQFFKKQKNKNKKLKN